MISVSLVEWPQQGAPQCYHRTRFDEVERMRDAVAIVDRGRVICQGPDRRS